MRRLLLAPLRWIGEKWAEADAYWAGQLSIGEDDE